MKLAKFYSSTNCWAVTSDYDNEEDIKQAFADGFSPLTEDISTIELGEYEKLEYQYSCISERTAPEDNSDVDTDEERKMFEEGKLSKARLSLLRREKLMAMTVEELTARAGAIKRIATNVVDTEKIDSDIERLKNQISDSADEVVSCYEASLLGEEPPYDIKEVAKKRKELRAQISTLEALKTSQVDSSTSDV